jgi:hypothetical protein
VLGGLVAGVAAALLANLTLFILTRQFGQSFDGLTWYTIARAAVISCVLLGFIYSGLSRRTKHPLVWFALIVLAVSTGNAVLITMRVAEAGFGRVAIPIHFVGALTAIVLIPRLAAAIPRTERPTQPARPIPPPIPTRT